MTVPLDYEWPTTPNELGIKRGTFIPPEGGWKENTVYVVDVAFSEFNVIHRALLRVGFHGTDSPLSGNYTGFLMTHQSWKEDGDDFARPGFAYFIRAISEVEGMAEPYSDSGDLEDDDDDA